MTDLTRERIEELRLIATVRAANSGGPVHLPPGELLALLESALAWRRLEEFPHRYIVLDGKGDEVWRAYIDGWLCKSPDLLSAVNKVLDKAEAGT